MLNQKEKKKKRKKYGKKNLWLIYSHCSIISVHPLSFVALNYVYRALMVIIVLLTDLCLYFRFPKK